MNSFIASDAWRILPGGDLQTILGNLPANKLLSTLPSAVDLIVPVGEHARVRVSVNVSRPESPMLLLVHGYCGSNRSPSVVKTAVAALARGYSVARMNLRNAGGTHALSQGLFNLLQWDDIGYVLNELRRRYGPSAVYAVGFSAGGNLLLNYLARQAIATRHLAAAINPPIDLVRTAVKVCLPRNWLYMRSFMGHLNQDIRLKRRLGEHYPDPDQPRARTIPDYDRRFVLPQTAFTTLHDYYGAASSLPHLEKIKVPALLLASRNDPLIPMEPFEEINGRLSTVSTILLNHGGHLGFIAHDGLRTQFWAANVLLRFFGQRLK